MSETDGVTDGDAQNLAVEDEADAVRSEMTDRDWQDVAESEFVDFVESGINGEPGLVFQHPEIGLHGFRMRKKSGVLEPCSFEQVQDGDRDE